MVQVSALYGQGGDNDCARGEKQEPLSLPLYRQAPNTSHIRLCVIIRCLPAFTARRSMSMSAPTPNVSEASAADCPHISPGHETAWNGLKTEGHAAVGWTKLMSHHRPGMPGDTPCAHSKPAQS